MKEERDTGSQPRRVADPSGAFLLLFLFNCAVGFSYFLFRKFDSNTLVNWNWITVIEGPWRLYIIFISAGLLPLVFEILEPRMPLRGSSPISKGRYLLILLAIALVIPLSRVPQVIIDSSRYFIQAKYLSLYGLWEYLRDWGEGLDAWTDLPLIPAFYGVSFKVFGEGPVGVLLINISLLVLTLCCLYGIGANLWSERVGVYSSLMLLFSYYLLIQLPLMLVDLGSMALFTFSLYLFIHALRRSDKSTLLYSGVCISASLLTKYSVWLFSLLIYPITILVLYIRFRDSSILKRATSILCLSLLILGLMIGAKYQVFKDQIFLLSGFQRHGLSRWKEFSLGTLFFQIHPLFSLMLFYALLKGIRRRDILLLIPSAGLLLFLCIHRSRYILPLLPLVSLLAGYGLWSLGSDRLRRQALATGMLTSLSIALFLYVPFLRMASSQNLTDAADYLHRNGCRSVHVVSRPQTGSGGNTAPLVALFDLYYRGEIISVTGWEVKQTEGYHPLVFTWLIKSPPFYPENRDRSGGSQVVIASELPSSEGFERTFQRSLPFFRYRSIVGVKGCAERNRP